MALTTALKKLPKKTLELMVANLIEANEAKARVIGMVLDTDSIRRKTSGTGVVCASLRHELEAAIAPDQA